MMGSDCNWTRTQNHLVLKQTLNYLANHLAKLKYLAKLDFAPVSSKEFLDIQATIECGFTLKRVRDMTRIYRHMMGSYLRQINVQNALEYS